MEAEVHEPDPTVVAAARRGDAAAFEELVRGCQADVWRLCLHLLRDPGLADDATQDAFVRAFRFLPRFRGDARFSTWLLSIARNCAVDDGRRLEVREALAALPLELREPVVLIDVLGLAYRDAARLLEVAEGTVKSRVHRAREALAAALAPDAVPEEEVT
jgi:RNA polymerase sigma-70 factor, ECF subfamily